MIRVLVTGAGGFIGSNLCPELLRSGMQVRAAVRSLGHGLPKPGLESFLVGEIGKDTIWEGALRGVDVVVHLAARTHVLQPDEVMDLKSFREVNVEGTRALAEAAAKAGIRRFVHLSSIKAVCETSPEPVGEDAPAKPVDAYGISKLESEEVFRGLRMDVAVIRPPLVYGPGVKANFLRLMKAIRRGFPLPVGCVQAQRSFLYVGNLVNAIVSMLRHPASGVFHVADDEAVSAEELVLRLGHAMNRRPRLLPIPVPVLKGAGRLVGRMEDVRRLTDPLVLSTEKIRSRIGWQPPFSLEYGLTDTATWYLSTTAAMPRG